MSEPKTVGEIVTQLPAAPPTPVITPLQMLQIAVERGADVAMLEKLVALQERMAARDAEREFIAAFARLSADLPHVKKSGVIDLGNDNKGNSRGSIPFARWEDMDKVIRPLMAREGFTLSFDSAPRQADGGGLIVTGTLMHVAGHTRTASMPLALDTGPGRNNLQAMGSTLSYGKRYCAEMLLNIVREGDDTDGQISCAFLNEEQVKYLDKLIKETDSDRQKFLDWACKGARELHEIPAAKFDEVKAKLLEKKGKKAK